MYEELVRDLRVMSIPCDGWVDLYAQAADAIEAMCEMAAVAHNELANVIESYEESKPRWIPVTERLPGDGDNVIVCTKSGSVGEAKYQAALGYDLDFPEVWFLLNDYGNQYQTEEIIAWMQLPELPKEE